MKFKWRGLECAWCGSTDTHFHQIRNWEEDDYGNDVLTDDFEDDYTPRDEIWWCDNCDETFVVPLEVDDGE